MALSNWDSLSIGKNGKSCSGVVESSLAIPTIERFTILSVCPVLKRKVIVEIDPSINTIHDDLKCTNCGHPTFKKYWYICLKCGQRHEFCGFCGKEGKESYTLYKIYK